MFKKPTCSWRITWPVTWTLSFHNTIANIDFRNVFLLLKYKVWGSPFPTVIFYQMIKEKNLPYHYQNESNENNQAFPNDVHLKR